MMSAPTLARRHRPLVESAQAGLGAVGTAAVYAAVVTAPLHVYRRDFGPFNISLFRVFIIITAGALFVRWLLAGPRASSAWPPRNVMLALLALVAWTAFEAIEATRSTSPLGRTLLGQHLAFVLSIAVLTIGAYQLRLPRRRMVSCALLSATIPFLLALYQWRLGDPSGLLPFPSLIGTGPTRDLARGALASDAGGVRPLGTFADPDFLALFAAVTFIFAETVQRQEHGWRRLAVLGLGALAAAVVVVSESRTGLVVVVAYIVAVLIRRRRAILARYSRRKIVGTVIVGALVATLLAIGPFAGEFGRLGSSVSTRQHFETRLSGLSIGLHHPVLGIGLGNLGRLFAAPLDRSSAHALPFTVIAEEGFIGVALGGLGLVLALRHAWRQRDELLAGLVVAIAVGIWLYDFIFVLDVAAVWWALLLTTRPRSSNGKTVGLVSGPRR
jgi:hypothetical protein